MAQHVTHPSSAKFLPHLLHPKPSAQVGTRTVILRFLDPYRPAMFFEFFEGPEHFLQRFGITEDQVRLTGEFVGAEVEIREIYGSSRT